VYGVDTVSRREYTLYVKDCAQGEVLEDRIPKTTGGATWANDNKTLFYTKKDPVTLRSSQIYKHVLGTDVSEDVLVFEEKDETFSCSVGKTKSEAYLVIASYATVSTEYRFLDANTPNGEWKVIQPRERDLEYSVSHFGDHFYLVTNKDAKNFKVVKTPVSATTEGKLGGRDRTPRRRAARGIDIFNDWLVVDERKEGLTHLRLIRWDGSADKHIPFNDPAYSAGVGANPDFNAKKLRYSYTSMTTPSSVLEYDFETGDIAQLKQQEVLGGTFDPGQLRERTAHGGSPRRRQGAREHRLPQRHRAQRQEPLAPLRVRQLRLQHGRRVLGGTLEHARPRVRVRHGPHPRRKRDGAPLVRGRQAVQQDEHLHRLHRLWPSHGGRRASPRPTTCTPWAAAPADC
jgi:protease II